MKKIILLIFLLHCTKHVDDSNLIVPGKSVGAYVLMKSTETEILGSDPMQAREAFAEKGLYFQFDQGRKLIGITITTPKYVTTKGIRVGSSFKEMKKVYHNPISNKIQNEKIDIDALIYNGIIFSQNNDKINIIQVTKFE